MYIRPDKKNEKYFERLLKDRVIYTNNVEFLRSIGRKYPDLFDEEKGFMDIAPINKRKKSMMVLRPYAGIAPIYPSSSRHSRKKYHFFKIF